jgi:hypothetical protein
MNYGREGWGTRSTETLSETLKNKTLMLNQVERV